ncbi:uncharacterized protein BN507_01766 [Bacteroides clarus CAG:160]|nr:uncharacterized protein BN507_01766 [Bacteroides clarus CAG:160]
MDAQRVEVLHIADRYAVVETVAYHLILHFFPAAQGFLHQYLRREGESLFHQHIQFFLIVAEARPQSAQRIGCTHYHRITQFRSGATGIFGILHSLALNGFYIDFIQLPDEYLTVFRIYDSLHGSTEHLYTVLLKNPLLVKLHAAVQRRLSAKSEHNAVGALFLDNFLHEIRGNGQEVNLVGHTFRGLHRSDVRVYKYGMDTFFFQCLERLRAGIVKLSRLTDFQCAGTKQQDFLYIVFFHLSKFNYTNNRFSQASESFLMYIKRSFDVYQTTFRYLSNPYSNFTNSSNRNSVSVGPLAASG